MEKQDIISKFPFPEPRPGQIETIDYILDAFLNRDKRFVILEAPTGTGKSVIGATVSNFFKSAYYITIQKFLQDQLVTDFGEDSDYMAHHNPMIDLKGRNAYECTFYKNNADKMLAGKLITPTKAAEYKTLWRGADEGHCLIDKSYKNCSCPYALQLKKAIASHTCLMNFSSFLAHLNYSHQFNSRELLVIDEGHNIESQLMSFVELSLNSNDLGCPIPEYDDPSDYAEWLEEDGIIERIKRQRTNAISNKNVKEVSKLTRLLGKLDKFIKEMQEGSRWISEYRKDNKITRVSCRPIWVRDYVHDYLFTHAKHILIMSATILNPNTMARSLAIGRNDMSAKRIGSTFPIENRPIYYTPVAKITGGKQRQHIWGPILVKAINKIANKYQNDKGIIHTHNFAITNLLLEECDHKVRDRLLPQKNYRDKKEMLAHHASLSNSILIAPAMHEGLDLKDDLSRWQIICKVPFPNFFDDKQLAARKEEDPDFVDWLTALKLCQCIGRSVRSEVDYADTYIIDESFGWWYNRNNRNIPVWIKEAIQGLT